MTFSIITPIYNMASTLDRAIQSVLVQSHENWELIIVDNCSEDQPEEVVDKYSGDARMRFLSIDEKDRSKARNHGIKESRGEFVTFLDADDTLHPDYLKTYVDIFNIDPDVICVSDLTVTRNGLSYILKKSKHSSLPPFEYALNYGHISIAGPRDIFTKYPFEGQLGEDRYLMAILSLECEFVFTVKPYYIYNDDYIFASEEEIKKRFVTENESIMQFYNKLKTPDIGEYNLEKAQYDLAIRNFYAAKFYSFDKLATEILFSKLMRPYSIGTFLKTAKVLIYNYTVHFKKRETFDIRAKT